ncbi:class I SAM-dependent methyltransferase [Nocardioides sp. NPDC059952]|uniref:class I SAM-dependent methyltransferase n=1 Tax=Nocardioides sp. NPDC059952 TaxID=3347014 RepID=UPI003667E5D9
MREPDAAFADARQAVLYDVFDDDRSDLDAYVAIAREIGARRIIDLGCGTGSLAVRLAGDGFSVVGVDPAGASVEVARTKPYADRVTWITGDATTLAGAAGEADMVVMTGNVAQVFVADEDWSATLTAVRAALRPGGCLVFETRQPEVRAWEGWNIAPKTVSLPDGRTAVVTRTVTVVDLPLVTFEGSTTIGSDVLTSTSTLRFRDRAEVEHDLLAHGFTVEDVRDAPDRPGLENVFLARVNA